MLKPHSKAESPEILMQPDINLPVNRPKHSPKMISRRKERAMAEFCSEPERFFGSVREAKGGEGLGFTVQPKGEGGTLPLAVLLSPCVMVFVGLCFVLVGVLGPVWACAYAMICLLEV